MNQITAEARLITLCAREPDAVAPGAVPAAAAAVTRWDEVVTVAAGHRVAAYVQAAATRAAIALPPTAARGLREEATAALMQVMRLDGELARVSEALRRASVPVIVLKGPALARWLYPAAAFRPYGDIDLTVRAEDEAAAVAALTGSGLREVPFAAEEDRRAHAGHVHEAAAYHRQFMSEGGGALIELHIDPLQLGIQPVCEAGRWQRAVPVPGLPHVLMLAAEDQVVQLAVHAHKHGMNRLIWLKDIDLLMRARGAALDWELVARVAALEGVSAPVWHTLDFARVLLGAPVPAAALARLRPSPGVRMLYRLVWPPAGIAGLRGHMRRRAVQFHVADSLRGMVPSLVLLGRRRERARATVRALRPG